MKKMLAMTLICATLIQPLAQAAVGGDAAEQPAATHLYTSNVFAGSRFHKMGGSVNSQYYVPASYSAVAYTGYPRKRPVLGVLAGGVVTGAVMVWVGSKIGDYSNAPNLGKWIGGTVGVPFGLAGAGTHLWLRNKTGAAGSVAIVSAVPGVVAGTLMALVRGFSGIERVKNFGTFGGLTALAFGLGALTAELTQRL